MAGYEDNRGITLVELLCAIAILAVLGASVAGIMLVGTKNFQNQNTEIQLQQEAQLTANQIADLVIDSTADITYAEETGSKKLEIYKKNQLFVLTYREEEKKIFYSEYLVLGDGRLEEVAVNQIMAEKVSCFEVDMSCFAENQSLALKLGFMDNDRSYTADYTITARNGRGSADLITPAATLITDEEITLEPNEEYELHATVLGPSDERVTWVLSGAASENTKVIRSGEKDYLHIGGDETAEFFMLTVSTNAKKEDGITPLARQGVTVKIRRVTGLLLEEPVLTEGTALKTGAVYEIEGKITGSHLDRVLCATYDENYVDTRTVVWNLTLSRDGIRITNADAYAALEPYEEVTGRRYARLRLLRPLEAGMLLTVTAQAGHPAGSIGGIASNKTGVRYASIEDSRMILGKEEEIISILGDIMRGKDTYFTTTIDKQALEELYGGKFYWFYRVRKKNADGTFGSWSNYTLMKQQGNEMKINALETQVFYPQHGYQFEIAGAVMSEAKENAVVYWPQNNEFLAGINLSTGSIRKGWTGEGGTSYEEYAAVFDMGEAKALFGPNEEYGVAENAENFGSASNPIHLYTGDTLEIPLQLTYLFLGKYQSNVSCRIYEGRGSSFHDNGNRHNGWDIQAGETIRIYNVTRQASGTYRIGVHLERAEFAEATGYTFRNNYHSNYQNYDLYNAAEDYGYIYVTFN